MEIRWDRLDPADWSEALPAGATALQHSWRYGAAVAALGRRVHRAELRQGDGILALAQVLVRTAGPVALALLPRGLAGVALPEDLRALRRSLPVRGARLLLSPGAHGQPLMTPAVAAELPLDPASHRMRVAMHGKWRNRLVRAEAAGLKVSATIPSAGDLARLLATEAAQARARRYRPLPPAFLHAWIAQPGPPVRLYTARRGGAPVAEMLFLDHPPGVTYHIGWSAPEGRRHSAHHLLLWRAMCDFGGQGRRRLDLGLVDTVTAPGLARFKLGSGARPCNLGATALILPGPPLPGWRPARFRRILQPPTDLTE